VTLEVVLIISAVLVGLAFQQPPSTQVSHDKVAFSSVAMRVKHMERMVTFYTEAFGANFHEVDTNGLRSQFGDVAGITLKLVPIREEDDFDGFPVHQLGFTVSDVERVIALAIKHGGRQEGRVLREGGRVHVAIRDPDGNTIELYEKKKSALMQRIEVSCNQEGSWLTKRIEVLSIEPDYLGYQVVRLVNMSAKEQL